jgi:hypothetical protein
MRSATSIVALIATVIAVLALSTSSAFAAGEGPGWELTAHTYPTYLPPHGAGAVEINVFNVGAGPSKGKITLTDTLPEGLTATDAGGLLRRSAGKEIIGHERWLCTGNTTGGAVLGASIVTCTNKEAEGPNEESLPGFDGGGGAPTFDFAAGPHKQPKVVVNVQASGEAVGLVNHATIVGGGAPTPASTRDTVTVSGAKPKFGFSGADGWFSNADGTLDTQAGSHPYEATFTLDLSSELVHPEGGEPSVIPADGSVRNIEERLPPGLVVNSLAVPQCTRLQLEAEECPNASQVGVVTSYFSQSGELGLRVFNMVPPPGVPGELGFDFLGVLTFLDGGVRSGSDYGITAHVNRIPQREIIGSVVTLWNVPGEASHDPWRNGVLGGCASVFESQCQSAEFPVAKPFLTLPTACGVPAPTILRADTWQEPESWQQQEYAMHDSSDNPDGFTGCEGLAFGPTIATSPDTSSADSPAGLTVEVKPPLGGLEEQGQLGTSDIQNTTVTLPEGFVVNPGQAAGLQACGPAEDGLTTEAEKAKGEEDNGPPSCPLASKVGTVKIRSPLIEDAAEKEFEGNVYLLSSNPPELRLLVAGSADGVNLKLVGEVHLNEQTGRLETTFKHTPELPFSVFKLSFSGGAQAALDTPTQCGTYATSAVFDPWSSPLIPNVDTAASFAITAGPGGAACVPQPLPFSPSLTAGSTTDRAGAFTNFSLLLQRGDGQQRIEKLQFKEPAGLAGLISSVPLCGEPQASQGQCGESSRIGHAAVASGPGPYPLTIPQPGEPESAIYLTGPYGGAPFGLSILTHVIAGPFNLGNIVTRAKIEVDPHTAQITITTDPFPQILDGVPTDLRLIDSVIDRPSFLFNPTSCNPQEFTGTAWGTPPPGAGGPGATAPISSHFGVGSCRELEYKPQVTVSTAGHASRNNGTSLHFKIAYPKSSLGHESWFKEAKFDIPKQLPARLRTIQQACTSATFEANPANCPAHSKIGEAVVHTEVLPEALKGPVYFVSYGNLKFPDAVILLSGDNVHIKLTGETFINKTTGVTSATFPDTPDVPFESIEVTLPSGEYSEFGSNLPHESYDFCGRKLTMPTLLKAQNGLEIQQNTPVAITGCAKAKQTRAQKLTAALRACRKDKNKAKRHSCEKQARKRYGTTAKHANRSKNAKRA